MGKAVKKIRKKAQSVKNRWKKFYMRHKRVSGITVIELVLILVRNFTPYLGCVLCG